MFRICMGICLYFSFAVLAHSEVSYSIDYINNGFFNYDSESGELVFNENRYESLKNGESFTSKDVFYRVNLHNKSIIETSNFHDRNDTCIGGRLVQRSRNGKYVASLASRANTLRLLNTKTKECRKLPITFDFVDYFWSLDGDVLIFKDMTTKSFYTINPQDFHTERYSDSGGGIPYTATWQRRLNTTLYSFVPESLLNEDPSSYTTDHYIYYYINNDGNWTNLKDEHPLMSDKGDVYFRWYSDTEEPPTTEFFDTKSQKQLSIKKISFWRQVTDMQYG